MPELPEVESVARGLKYLEGQRLRELLVVDPRVWFESELAAADIAGRRLREVSRRGKYLLLRFEGASLLQHLRMTGKMLEAGSPALPDLAGGPKRFQFRCTFQFERSSVVFFDTRRFGTVTAVADEEAFFARKRIAPDPIESEAAARNLFLERLRATARPVKSALLDQTVAAGVGNIYADEALFLAGIDPRTLASRVKDPGRLWAEIVGVLRSSIEHGGSTINDYVNAAGEKGGYGANLRVYGREGEACPGCGKPLRRIVLGGRATHFCGACQKKSGR